MEKVIKEPVELPETDEDATPMERLTAFARRIVNVPKDEIDKQERTAKRRSKD